MPIYLYQCPKCGYQSEELVMPGEEQTKKCPKCQKAKMEQRPTTISLKGSQDCDTCAAKSCQGCFKK